MDSIYKNLPNDLIIKIINDRKVIKQNERYKKDFNKTIKCFNTLSEILDDWAEAKGPEYPRSSHEVFDLLDMGYGAPSCYVQNRGFMPRDPLV